MAVTSVSVILTVFVLKLHHCGPRQSEVPSWVRCFVLGFLARAVHCPPGFGARRPAKRRERGLRKVSEKLPTMDEVPLRPFHDCSIRKHYDIPDFRPHGDTPPPPSSVRTQQRCDVMPEVTGFGDVVTEATPTAAGAFDCCAAGTAASMAVDIRRLNVVEEILRYLKLVVHKKDEEERESEVVNEWRQVASVMDRFLFWCFLTTTMIGTIMILIVIPLYRQ